MVPITNAEVDLMAIDVFAVLKALWGFATFVLLGVLKITYSDYKKMQEHLDTLDKDLVRMKAEMVTKDRLDETLDRKVKHLQVSIQGVKEDVSDLRREIKGEVSGLRSDIQSMLKAVLERK